MQKNLTQIIKNKYPLRKLFIILKLSENTKFKKGIKNTKIISYLNNHIEYETIFCVLFNLIIITKLRKLYNKIYMCNKNFQLQLFQNLIYLKY